MTMPAPRLVRLAPANHDDRTVPQRRLAVHQALVSRRRAAAHYAERLELVHHFRDAHERRHRTERQAAEVDIGSRENVADAPVSEVVRHFVYTVIQYLRLWNHRKFCAG